MNIQGSCNNLCDTSPDPADMATEIRWAAREYAI